MVRLTYVTGSGISVCCCKTDKWNMNRMNYLLNQTNRILLRVGYQYISQYITLKIIKHNIYADWQNGRTEFILSSECVHPS